VCYALPGAGVVLLKPQTYMNLSGESVSAAVGFYKIPPADRLLVVYDDMDLPLGTVRIRKHGGHGGHNGMRSIIEQLGTDQFARIRVGIGRNGEATEHVLGLITSDQLSNLFPDISRAADAIERVVSKGIDIAMNEFNRKKDEP
jgi:peptidyl-tRNA hydrolase, PTH1 family